MLRRRVRTLRRVVAEGATVTGVLDFVAGADGATVTQINGTTLVFGGDGYSQVIDIGAGFDQGEGRRERTRSRRMRR